MDENDVRTYLQEVVKVPVLPRAQQIALFQELEHVGPHAALARRRLIEVNLRLAVSVARKYVVRGLSLGELVEASNIGLMRAVEKFDYRKGVPFSTYAVWWMRQAIVRDLKGRAVPN